MARQGVSIRFEGCLLSAEESRALIDEMDRWCRKTGTNYNKLVVVARVAPSIRSMVRFRSARVTFDVAARLQSTMQRYRGGITRDEYGKLPKPWGCTPRVVTIVPKPEPIRVSTETCRRCGAREGNCEHTALSAVRVAAR